jgi:uncharacterized protein YuzE
MRVEYDTEVGAFYAHVSDAEIARTADVADLIDVDVAADGTVVGLELLCSPGGGDHRGALHYVEVSISDDEREVSIYFHDRHNDDRDICERDVLGLARGLPRPIR